MRTRFDERYKKLYTTLFIAGASIIIFYFCLKNIHVIHKGFLSIVSILMPFIYGLVIAYLLCPIYNAAMRNFYHRFKLKIGKKNAFIFAKIMATIASMLLFITIIVSAVALLLPHIVNSIVALVDVIPKRAGELSSWLSEISEGTQYQSLTEHLAKAVDNTSENIMGLIRKYIMPNVGSYVEMVSEGVIFTLKTFMNIFVGVIVSVYFLNSKEKFKAQATKLVYAFLPRQKAEAVFEFGNFANRTFGGFISGKIIDSLLIGLICFVAMIILKLPYPILCSTIIGVTNIIPFFGPFIGAIPTAIIICVVDPVKAGEFLILIFLLQQFDGNILGPKILGDSTGLSSFWVMFSIIFFGGLFGFTGMLLGVPSFALFYHYFKRKTEKELRMKGLSEDTKYYQEFNKYDIDRNDIL